MEIKTQTVMTFILAHGLFDLCMPYTANTTVDVWT